VQVVVEFKIEDGTGFCEDKRARMKRRLGWLIYGGVMKVYKYFENL
jgi:hypothetical protein